MIHFFTSELNWSTVMPVSVAASIFSRSGMVNFAIASRLPERTVLNGSRFASSGFAFTTAGTRSRQYITCVYIGCSTHSVPSWSNVAMRSSDGTNFGLDWSVVACTNSIIAFFAGPLFQEGKGSAACALRASASVASIVNAMSLTGFMVVTPFLFIFVNCRTIQ